MISLRFAISIRIQVPIRRSFPMKQRSVLPGKYALFSIRSHRPIWKHSKMSCYSVSFSDSLLICLVDNAHGVCISTTNLTYVYESSKKREIRFSCHSWQTICDFLFPCNTIHRKNVTLESEYPKFDPFAWLRFLGVDEF